MLKPVKFFLICERFLFKKLLIVLKGQTLKLHGAIAKQNIIVCYQILRILLW